jgi:polysaccharide export outer membrane protein
MTSNAFACCSRERQSVMAKTEIVASILMPWLLPGLVACAAPRLMEQPVAPVPAAPAQSSQPHPVGPGDIIQVYIYAGGEKQEDFIAEISPQGTMNSPLIGELAVGGLTTFEVTSKMRDVLKQAFFVNPQVLINVKEYGKKVYVLGEVKQPGAYSIQEGLTTLNACILAGGFTDYAALGRARVTRQENGKALVININLAKVQEGRADDLVLQGGDRIEVPPRRF